jgi:hypothetical protein
MKSKRRRSRTFGRIRVGAFYACYFAVITLLSMPVTLVAQPDCGEGICDTSQYVCVGSRCESCNWSGSYHFCYKCTLYWAGWFHELVMDVRGVVNINVAVDSCHNASSKMFRS